MKGRRGHARLNQTVSIALRHPATMRQLACGHFAELDEPDPDPCPRCVFEAADQTVLREW
jgi:hypothetical protein